MARRVVIRDLCSLEFQDPPATFGGLFESSSDVQVLAAHKHNQQLKLVLLENSNAVGKVTVNWLACSHLETSPVGFTFIGVVSKDFYTWAIFTRIT